LEHSKNYLTKENSEQTNFKLDKESEAYNTMYGNLIENRKYILSLRENEAKEEIKKHLENLA
jgi:hypothetical protein